MKIRQNLEEVLKQEIDRKEFFALTGAGLLAIFGIHNILKVLMPSRGAKSYSGGSYGGKE